MKVDMPELDVLDKLDLILKYSKDDKKLLWARNKRALLFLKNGARASRR